MLEKVGADVKAVATAMGKDGRIRAKFLHPGPGYGATILANEAQKLRMVDKIEEVLESLKGKKLAVQWKAKRKQIDRAHPLIAVNQ